MILSAGLTPAWQQILLFDGFRYGEVNRATEVHACASGKVFNAGIAVARLAAANLTLAPVGGIWTKSIEAEFDALAVNRRFIHTAAPTRVCTTLLDRATGSMTELVENGRPLSNDELEQFAAAFAEEAAQAAGVIFIGSLPDKTPVSYYRRLLSAVRCPMVLDFRGEGLRQSLPLRPLLVKPNREELARTVDNPLDDDRTLVAAMQQLNHAGAQWVLVTHGAGPAWLTSQEQVMRLYPPVANTVVNPIGCGDAIAAGVAVATERGADIVEAVRYGMAAAHANLQQLLPCRFDTSHLNTVAASIRVEKGLA